jgi:hypothetical protein
MKQTLNTSNPLSDALSNAKTTINITPHSFRFNDYGDELRGYFLGVKPFPRKNKSGVIEMAEAAYFFDGQKIWHNMGCSLLRQLRDNHIPIGAPISIVYVFEKPNKFNDGKTKEYDILPLPIEYLDTRGAFGDLSVGALPAPKDVEGVKEAANDALRDKILADVRAKFETKSTGDPLGDLGFIPDAVPAARVTEGVIPF